MTTAGIQRTAFTFVVVIAIAAVAIGFWLNGSPWENRRAKFDRQRAVDLVQLTVAVDKYRERVGKLPDSLEQLTAVDLGKNARTTDPADGTVYGYRVLDEHRYELCAVFVRPYRERDDGAAFHQRSAFPELHAAGRRCKEEVVRTARGR